MHLDSLNWFRADLTRDQTEEELKNKPSGTYLVRRSSYASNKYVLSVVANLNQIIHIVIDESQNKYCLKPQNKQRRLEFKARSDTNRSVSPMNESKSLSDCALSGNLSNSSSSITSSQDDLRNLKRDQINKFDTLTDLIVFYSTNTLPVDKNLNIVLQTPAFCDLLLTTAF